MIQVIIEYPAMLQAFPIKQLLARRLLQHTIYSVVNSVYMETEALQSIQ